MPKSKKAKLKQNKKKFKHLNRTYVNPMLINRKQHIPVDMAPFPPKILDPEDFTKDLIDVGDANSALNATSFSESPTTSMASKTTTTVAIPKIVGQKIPVNMREDIVRKQDAAQNPATKQAHVQSNQLLKDCLSSDIKSVVQDNIKSNIPKPQLNKPIVGKLHAHTSQIKQFVNLPSGVPRSFLIRANQTVIEPQLSVVEPKIHTNFIPIIQRQQYNPPFNHVNEKQPQYVPTVQNNPQVGHSVQTLVNNPPVGHSAQTLVNNPPVGHSAQTLVNNPQLGHSAQTLVNNPQVGHSTQTLVNNPQVGHSAQTLGNAPYSSRYSPTDLYSDLGDENKVGGQVMEMDDRENSSTPDLWHVGEKRVSAFDRLGPLAQPKTPKLTINLSFNKDQSVREVVDESTLPPQPPAKVYVPVHEREDILLSTDETVMKYVGIWPWAKAINIRRTAKSRGYLPKGTGDESTPVGYSPTAMMMLKEQMDEIYQRDNTFLAVSVTGYPANWSKEDVLDAMLDNLKGKSFVPCFIEFNNQECKFLVIRSRAALLAIHALDFHIQKDAVQLSISISQITLSVMQLDFIPRLILRKRLTLLHCDGTKLNLSAFTLQPDVSHFIYYPLNQLTNQFELMKLQTDIIWSNLTELDLSNNRLTTVEGFDLENRLLKLRQLDLSYNWIEKATMLLCCRKLSLSSLKLEGNPLCHDYIDPQQYVTVLKMMFPTLRRLDDIPIHVPGDLPVTQRNYCLYGAAVIIDHFLQLYLPLLDSHTNDRVLLSNMYAEDAFVTITYRQKNYDSDFKYPRSLLLFSRVLLEGSREFVHGIPDIEKLLRRWPNFEHDPSSFTVDVIFHNESSTLFRLDGIVKLPADSLAENDQLIAFTRTIHLHTSNGVEYKIKNEMIYWAEPTEESTQAAFTRTLVKRKPLSFKFELPPDEDCKKKILDAFMKLSRLEERLSQRCLEMKDWDLKEALDYFIKLYKADNFEPLKTP